MSSTTKTGPPKGYRDGENNITDSYPITTPQASTESTTPRIPMDLKTTKSINETISSTIKPTTERSTTFKINTTSTTPTTSQYEFITTTDGTTSTPKTTILDTKFDTTKIYQTQTTIKPTSETETSTTLQTTTEKSEITTQIIKQLTSSKTLKHETTTEISETQTTSPRIKSTTPFITPNITTPEAITPMTNAFETSTKLVITTEQITPTSGILMSTTPEIITEQITKLEETTTKKPTTLPIYTKRPSTRGDTSLEYDYPNITTRQFTNYTTVTAGVATITTEKYEITPTTITIITTTPNLIDKEDNLTMISSTTVKTFMTCTKISDCASNETCINGRCLIICQENASNINCVKGTYIHIHT